MARKTALPQRLLLVSLFVVAPLASLHAQATKIFVASSGNDANDGSRGSPKRNFQAAHDAVASGGDVVVLDTAGYGALNITKSVNFIVPPGVNGFVTVSSGVAITVTAGPNERVSLRGLVIEGVGASATIGVNCGGIGTLEMTDCVVQGFSQPGVAFSPAAGGLLVVERCTVRACGNASTGGCFVKSSGTNTTRATLVDCAFLANSNGLFVDNASSTATVRVTARRCTASSNVNVGFFLRDALADLQDCTATDNAIGVSTRSANASCAVTLLGCSLCNNATGVESQGASVTTRLDACAVTNNTTNGISGSSSSIFSRSNNTIAANASNTAFGTYTAQ